MTNLSQYIFLCTFSLSERAAHLYHLINHHFEKNVCSLQPDLRQMLIARSQSPLIKPITLLLAANQAELDRIIAFKVMFAGLPTILQLPNRRQITFQKAHLLQPRYLIWPDTKEKEILTTLESFLRHAILTQRRAISKPLTTHPTQQKELLLVNSWQDSAFPDNDNTGGHGTHGQHHFRFIKK